MKSAISVGLLLLTTGIVAAAADELQHVPQSGGVAASFAPAGGWNPYPCGGGIFSWWPRCCFPCGGPDDYCPKPLPCTCWPVYPSYYTFGTPNDCGTTSAEPVKRQHR